VSRLCDRSAADASGLDTYRRDLGFLSPTIREWHEIKLRAPRRHFSTQRRAANETLIFMSHVVHCCLTCSSRA
jgi:hypothetical protein